MSRRGEISEHVAERLASGKGAEVYMGSNGILVFFPGSSIAEHRDSSIMVVLVGKPAFYVSLTAPLSWCTLLGMAYNAGEAKVISDLVNEVRKDLLNRAIAPIKSPLAVNRQESIKHG